MGNNPQQYAAGRHSPSCSEAMSKIYSGAMFRGWSTRAPHLAPHEARLLDVHCPRRDLSVLDLSVLNVGCGNGRETFGIYEAGFHNVRGVDITPEFVKLAKERSREMRLDLEFVVAPADRLPYPDNSFSVLTMFENLLGHVTPRPARLAVLVEARRVLKSGGLLLLEATNICHKYHCFLWIRIAEVLRRFYNPCQLERGDKLVRDAHRVALPAAELPRSHWFRPGEVEFDAEEQGFEVVQSTTVKHIMSDPCADAFRYRGEGRFLYVLRKPPDNPPGNEYGAIKFPQ